MTCFWEQQDDVLESEEAYYLRRINSRSNGRILLAVAEEFKLQIPTVSDSCGYDRCDMASCTTETLFNDMHRQRDGRISVFSKCMDTTRIENGMLCSMHPSEGFWLFKVTLCCYLCEYFRLSCIFWGSQGAQRTNSSLHCYGGPFGTEAAQTSLSTCMHKMHSNYSWRSKPVPSSSVCNRPVACSVESRNNNPGSGSLAKVECLFAVLIVCCFGSKCVWGCEQVDFKGSVMPTSETHVERYTYMDEDYIRSQQEVMLWNRDNGIIELMPIAVVYQGDSDIF